MENSILPSVFTFKVGSDEYKVEEMLALDNLQFFFKIQAFFGDAITGIFVPRPDTQKPSDAFCHIASQAIHQIAIRVHQDDRNLDFLFEILRNTTRNGVAINKANFNDIYNKGKVGESLVAVTGSIKAHLAPFLKRELVDGLANAGIKITLPAGMLI